MKLFYFLKIQRFVRTYRDAVRVNTISSIKNTVKNNLYHDKINEDKFFFFGVEFDSEKEPILGSGKCEVDHKNKKIKCSSLSHLNLMMTSVKLMDSIEEEGN